ncbi:MAG: F-box protein [Gammaproteobacteria bacterium]|nr:F-box protein [Gammaproteobacteria bacterium]MCW5582512.1 F-box protein [Gammaproteobacteria bacterium]
MSLSRPTEQTPLIQSSGNNDVLIPIDSHEESNTDVSDKNMISSMPQEIIDKISEHFSGQYFILARLAQTSKKMQNLIANTKEGKKACRARQINPTKLNQWILKNHDTVIPFTTTMTCIMLGLGGIATSTWFAHHSFLTDETPTNSNPIDNQSLILSIIVAVSITVTMAGTYAIRNTCQFFANQVRKQNDEVEKIYEELTRNTRT